MSTAYSLTEYRAQVAEYKRLGRERVSVLVRLRCGHEASALLRLDLPPTDADIKAARVCEPCVLKQVQEQERENARLRLPAMTGTPRQLCWAHDLRFRAVERHGLLMVEAAVFTQLDAAWWIQNRSRLPHSKVFGEVTESCRADLTARFGVLLTTGSKPGPRTG